MNFINIKMPDGHIEKLEVLEEIKIQDKNYVVVAPEDSDEAYAYRVTEENGFREYESIGEGKEFEMILEKFNEIQNNG